MSRLIASHDWSATSLGPINQWPEALKLSVGMCLNSRFPMIIWWGADLTMLYNDAYTGHLASKHPRALGKPGVEVWTEIWDVIGPMLRGVLETGEPTWSDDLLLYLHRNGFKEETYHTFSYSAIRDVDGKILGIFTPVAETTEKNIAERRLRTLRALSTESRSNNEEEVLTRASDVLKLNASDLPYFMFLALDEKHGVTRLLKAHGMLVAEMKKCSAVSLNDNNPLAEAIRRVSDTCHLTSMSAGFFKIESVDFERNTAAVISLAPADENMPAVVMVAGVSSHLQFNDVYGEFFESVAREIGLGIAESRSFRKAQERVESLAALDRAKTVFFSNVSHEFRTPLTLMLGPLQSLLENNMSDADMRAELKVAHRNGLRLKRLVNTLLDFSRIEAGRVDAVFEPVDLSLLTTDLASSFRSLMEKGNLKFTVDCPTLPELVYVDRDMWEKIVLNLLSNAFKFTLKGEVAVRLRNIDKRAILTVSDTGCGIAEDELGSMFERFHRIKDAKSRTHEGTGIGLSFVQQLTRLLGGEISVKSEFGTGSVFSVEIPFGKDHLPPDKIAIAKNVESTSVGADAYVGEASTWIDASESPSVQLYDEESAELYAGPLGVDSQQLILVADDNSDMREYIVRLLKARWKVIAVPDGATALVTAIQEKPDLILSDVMMPGLDGLQLLAKLRQHAELRDTPVVLLSARAGEEARVEGLESGADDYLTKPFVARELLAHVNSNLMLAKMRREEAVKLELLVDERTVQLRDANRKLEIARDEALELSRLKSEFISNVSHEIRTPMGGIIGFSELLCAASELSPDTKNIADIILSSSQRLMKVVSQILDYAKLEANMATLESLAISVADLVGELATNIRLFAESKNLDVAFYVEPALENVLLYGDPTRIRQALLNLTQNAVKFTESGEVKISAHIFDVSFEITWVKFSVADTGIGISEKAATRLGEPFVQADGSVTRKYGGTGLGLSIVKRTAELMGGSFGFESEIGKGSTFWIIVPLSVTPAPQ